MGCLESQQENYCHPPDSSSKPIDGYPSAPPQHGVNVTEDTQPGQRTGITNTADAEYIINLMYHKFIGQQEQQQQSINDNNNTTPTSTQTSPISNAPLDDANDDDYGAVLNLVDGVLFIIDQIKDVMNGMNKHSDPTIKLFFLVSRGVHALIAIWNYLNTESATRPQYAILVDGIKQVFNLMGVLGMKLIDCVDESEIIPSARDAMVELCQVVGSWSLNTCISVCSWIYKIIKDALLPNNKYKTDFIFASAY